MDKTWNASQIFLALVSVWSRFGSKMLVLGTRNILVRTERPTLELLQQTQALERIADISGLSKRVVQKYL